MAHLHDFDALNYEKHLNRESKPELEVQIELIRARLSLVERELDWIRKLNQKMESEAKNES